MVSPVSPRPRTAIPWYVHPAEDPESWAALPGVPDLSLLVLNIADGPGAADDPYYPEALAALPRLPWLGYVNLDYGRRPTAQVLADARAWRERYAVTSLFLDCVPGPEQQHGALRRLVRRLRPEVDRLVGNPGQAGYPDLVRLFDVTVVFEDGWDRYRQAELPAWHADLGPDRLWHLVHSCPTDTLDAAWELAATRPVGHFFATDRTMPHPWQGFATTARQQAGAAPRG